jgi:ABC-type phosphate/phosphonate transport system substrate-binding protein
LALGTWNFSSKKGCLVGRVCVWLAGAILPVAVVLVPGARTEAAEPSPLKIGLPESMFNGLPAAVVAPASKPFQTMFEKQTGLKGEIAIGKDYQDLCDQLRSGKLDIAVFHGFEYAWVKQSPELVPLLVTVPGHKLQACLVVNAESKLKSPEALKGATVAVPSATKAHCRLYFDRLKATLPEGCCGTAKLESKAVSVEEALDAVVGGTCPAALVDASALLGYQRNKPGGGAQLKVLDESPVFPSAVIVYRKDAFDAKTAQKVRDGLIKGTGTPQGQLLTSLWKLKGFAEVTPPYEAEVEKCLKAYPAPKK